MTRTPRILWILVSIAIGLCACQPVPRPFQPDDKSVADRSQLPINDKVGVFVAKVEGAPPATDWALTGALVDRLHQLNIAAGRATANRASYVLRSNAIYYPTNRERGVVTLSWRLLAANGDIVGLFEQAEISRLDHWRSAGPDLVSAISNNAAPRIAALIQDPAAAPPAPMPDVVVQQVEGAPGDGATALAMAMRTALRHRDVRVVRANETPAQRHGALVVRGAMQTDTNGPEQRIELTWSILGTDGVEIGSVAQANSVPAGLLDQAWGEIAYVIAANAADGVVALLQAAHASTIR